MAQVIPQVRIGRHEDMSKGGDANVTALSLGAHTGTHMDAPVHFLADGVGIEAMDLAATMGAARVIQIGDPVAIRSEEIERAEIVRGERILWEFAQLLLCVVQRVLRPRLRWHVARRSGVSGPETRVRRTVGVDYLSVAASGGDAAGVHRALLFRPACGSSKVSTSPGQPSRGELRADLPSPLDCPGSNGAPARALLRPLDRGV